MQVASVWPNVTYVTSNQNEDGGGTGPIRMSLVNNGVGPAIVRGLQIGYDGRKFTSFRELLEACCAEREEQMSIGISSINNEVLRPGEDSMFAMMLPAAIAAAGLMKRLE